MLMVGFDLETETEVARLLFEAQMAAEAAAMGCEAVGRAAEGWRDKTKIVKRLAMMTPHRRPILTPILGERWLGKFGRQG